MLQQYTNIFIKVKGWLWDVLFPTPQLPQNIKLNQTLFCSVCRARLARNVKICHKDSQYKLGAATSYDNKEIRKMIWQLKYRGRTGNAVYLAILLTDYLKNLGIKLKNYEVLPVPLSKKRGRSRGYNQAQIIAKIVAANLGLQLSSAVSKIKDTPAQAETKDWEERKKNLENCFAVANLESVKDKNFIILDDVFTSGATLNEIARTLKNAGARRILGLVVAKAG